jgi:transposase
MKTFRIFRHQLREEIKDIQRYIDTVDNDKTTYYFYIKDKENDSDIIKITIMLTAENMKEFQEEDLKRQINKDLKSAVTKFDEIGLKDKMSEIAFEILHWFEKNILRS